MRVNLLANPSYYRTHTRQLGSKQAVLNVLKEFIRANVNGEDYFEKMFSEMEKPENHVIRFDSSDEPITRHGNEGSRVAYGAFRHSAFIHTTQTVWTYTFEILDTGSGLYLGTDSWGWLQSADLDKRVTTHLEGQNR